MNIKYIFVCIFLLITKAYKAQNDSIDFSTPTFKNIPKDKLKKDEYEKMYYYDSQLMARVYEINGERVLVLDELLMSKKPIFNNELDRNFYYFLNQKLNRVYPYFLVALKQYRDIQKETSSLQGREKTQYIRRKQSLLADEYETKLRKLTTTEGRIFAKLMNRATGKTVYEIIKELRGGWSAFWWNIKGNIADIDIKDPYDPRRLREDYFVETLLVSNWNMGSLQPYEGYAAYEIK